MIYSNCFVYGLRLTPVNGESWVLVQETEFDNEMAAKYRQVLANVAPGTKVEFFTKCCQTCSDEYFMKWFDVEVEKVLDWIDRAEKASNGATYTPLCK